MEVVVFTNLFVILFAFFESEKILKNGLKISFLFLFIFLALRLNFGNDYIEYVKIYNDVTNGLLKVDWQGFNLIEIGWIYLCLFFKPFGFYFMVAILSFINCFVFYKFIKKHAPLKYYWLSIFIYLFNPFLFLVESSAMRQSLALSLFLISIPYIINRNFIKFIGLIILASFFHKSSLVLLFSYFTASPKIITKKTIVIYIAVFVVTLLFGEIIFSTMGPFINQYFEKYTYETDTIEGGKFGSGIGFLILIYFFGSLLYYSLGEIGKSAVIYKIALFFYAIYPLSLYFQLFGRFEMYYEPSLIITMPLIVHKIKNPLYKKFFIFLILFYYLYIFIDFFDNPLWKSFYEYRTIFSY
jgi:hypothetical protein